MRTVTFKNGSLLEGIPIKNITGIGAITVGRPGQGQSSILLSPDDPPVVKDGKIYSVAMPEPFDEYMLHCPNNCGPHKRRNNKTLVLIDCFHTFFQDREPAHFGGNWSVSRGNPKVLAQAEIELEGLIWTESLVVMSPSDIISVAYHKKDMKSFFLLYEGTHRGRKLVSHDSIYHLKSLNERRPEDKDERRQMRKLKEAKRLFAF